MNRDEDGKSVRLYDVRTVERNIRKGLTNRKDYDKYLKSLPDVADKAAPPEAPGMSAADDDDDLLDDEDDEDDFDDDEPETASEEPGNNGVPTAS